MEATKDYFLDDNGKVTTDQEKAATLLIRKGQEISKEMSDKYPEVKGVKADEDAPAKATKPAATKAKTPAENK